MLKEIVSVGVTGFILVYMLLFVIPITRQAYNTELSGLNTTSTLMQTILPITSNWWVIFPMLIAVAGGFSIWQIISHREAFDYG